MSEIINVLHNDGPPTCDYYCSTCDNITDGFSICLKCNPQTYEVYGMKDDSLDDTHITKRSERKCICHTDAVALGLVEGPMHVMPCCEEDIVGMGNAALKGLSSYQYKPDSVGKQEDCSNVYAKQIWNEAIEAAAEVAKTENVPQFYVAEQIRKLKK